LVGRMRRDEDIVRVGGTHGEGMILISWVVEVDQQGVAPVNSDQASWEIVVSLEPCR